MEVMIISNDRIDDNEYVQKISEEYEQIRRNKPKIIVIRLEMKCHYEEFKHHYKSYGIISYIEHLLQNTVQELCTKTRRLIFRRHLTDVNCYLLCYNTERTHLSNWAHQLYRADLRLKHPDCDIYGGDLFTVLSDDTFRSRHDNVFQVSLTHHISTNNISVKKCTGFIYKINRICDVACPQLSYALDSHIDTIQLVGKRPSQVQILTVHEDYTYIWSDRKINYQHLELLRVFKHRHIIHTCPSNPALVTISTDNDEDVYFDAWVVPIVVPFQILSDLITSSPLLVHECIVSNWPDNDTSTSSTIPTIMHKLAQQYTKSANSLDTIESIQTFKQLHASVNGYLPYYRDERYREERCEDVIVQHLFGQIDYVDILDGISYYFIKYVLKLANCDHT